MSQHQEATIGRDPALHPYGAGYSLPSYFHPYQNEDDYLVSYEAQTYAVFGAFGAPGPLDPQDTARRESYLANIAVETFYNHYAAQPLLVHSDEVAFSGMKQVLLATHRNIIIEKTEKYGKFIPPYAIAAAALHFYETEEGRPRAVVGHHAFNRAYHLPERGRLRYLTLDYDYDDDWQAAPESPNWNPRGETKTLKKQEFYDQLTDYHSVRPRKFEKMKMDIIMDLWSWNRLGHQVYEIPPTKVTTIDIRENDRFLLSSDGIHKNLTKDEIEEILKGSYEPQLTARNLVEAARERSGMIEEDNLPHRARPDDMTAVVINVPRKS